MTPESARRTILLLSLGTLLVFTAYLILAPLFHRSMGGADAFGLVQIVFPVFAGYIGSAAMFLVRPITSDVEFADAALARYVVWGVFGVFWALAGCLFLYHFVSNFPGGVEGMSVPQLATYLTLFLALMNATVGVLTGALFRTEVAQVQDGIRNAQATGGTADNAPVMGGGGAEP